MNSNIPRAYRVERIGALEDLDGLRAQWEGLLAEIPGCSVSLTWDWVSAWCRHREPEWDMWVLVAYDQEGVLRGVAPWVRTEHRVGPVRVKRLAFVGDSRAYRMRMDIIASPAEKPVVFAAFMAYLNRNPDAWDVLDLEALVGDSDVVSALGSAGGHVFEVERLVSPCTRLPGTWEQYERAQLSSDYRWQLRNRKRRLEKAYPDRITFTRVGEASELPAAMDALAALHQKRWHGKGQGSSFDHVSFMAFHQDLAGRALANDWLRLYLIKVGDQPIAAEYAFLYRGVLTGYSTAFDLDYGDYNPGQLVLAYMIQDAIAEGVQELDLGRGSFDYKFRWTDDKHLDLHLALSATPRGYLWTFSRLLMRRLQAWARSHVPASWRERVNRGQVLPRRATVSQG